MSTMWETIDPTQMDPLVLLGGPVGVSDDVTTGGLGSSGIVANPAPWSPDHPLFWFGAVAAFTVGLIGASTHLRVGPFKADASLGRSRS